MEKNFNDQLKEIQDEFQHAMNTWAYILLDFEIKMEELHKIPLKYDSDCLMDATVIFRHVLFNIAYHNNKMNIDNAEELGNDIRDLIKKYTDVDTRTHYNDK